MEIEIRRYEHSKDYSGLLELIQSEGEDWKDYLNPRCAELFKKSITYIASSDGKLCGFSRSLNDSGLYVWVIDLLVGENHRGNSIGKKLMECLLVDYLGQGVFVMSDVDGYYRKLGYEKEGSIFKVG